MCSITYSRMTQIEDEVLRSKTFYRLSDMIDELNRTMDMSAPATRRLIMYKLRKLSEQGILPRSEVDNRLQKQRENIDNIE